VHRSRPHRHGRLGQLTASGPERYTFVEHRRYLGALLESLGVRDRVTLVVHDWGSALGFDWARRHPESVKGIADMEAIVRPLAWLSMPDAIRPLFQALKSPAGDDMVLVDNIFVERVLPGAVLRHLDPTEMAEYRRPYVNAGEDRRPALTRPRQIPIDGDPADVTEIVASYAAWLETTPVPKLLVVAEPGAILRGEQLDYCRTWANQTEVTVKGAHFIQEDSPDDIGSALAAWLEQLALTISRCRAPWNRPLRLGSCGHSPTARRS
jgi:haloalkane dehalogenase